MTELQAIELQLYRAATLLRPVLDRIVFVGGAVRGLLVTDSAVEGPRTTDDVDTIIEVASLNQYQEFESELRALDFKNDMREDAPLCRYVYETVTLDVMPTEHVIGFSNRWYLHAHQTAIAHEISSLQRDPITIRVVSASSFIATKLVSYLDRGIGNWYHRDLEDIIVVVDGRPSLLDELELEKAELRQFVGAEMSRLLANDLEQYVPGHLPGDPANQARLPIVLTRLRRIARCAKIARLGDEWHLLQGGDPGATGQTNGAWTYVIHEIDAAVDVPHGRPKGMFVAVFARLTNHGDVAGTAGDGRAVHIEDANGIRHPPNYAAIGPVRQLRNLPGPYDTIWPNEPFETAWVYDLPVRRAPYRLLLPSDGIEFPLELMDT
jgi:hypothetical protein